jgi:hypothetical protein
LNHCKAYETYRDGRFDLLAKQTPPVQRERAQLEELAQPVKTKSLLIKFAATCMPLVISKIQGAFVRKNETAQQQHNVMYI